ncbi:hypothetical protein C8R46DRAFT_1091778 [Mycena filopes]|nr:hypothetical protein C8R46DRAFT_1091778 [Mycena filopes]
MAMTGGLGLGDQVKTTKELDLLLRPMINSFYRSARSSYNQLQRTARIIQNLCRSLNPWYLLNVGLILLLPFVPLPFDIPLEHLISVLALNGLIVWILQRVRSLCLVYRS